MSNEEVMIPKSYHDKVCEEIIRFKDKQFYDAVHLLDDGTLEIHVTDYKMVKRVLVEDDNNFGNLFCEDKANRPQGEWIPCSERLPQYRDVVLISTFWGVRVAERDGIKEDGTDDFWYLFLNDATAHPRYVYAWMPLPEPWKGADDE